MVNGWKCELGLEELEDASYDVIVSKDVFEHVDELFDVFPNLIDKLKPGGKILLGFGPLWYSPFGDHGISKRITGVKVPWMHLFISDTRKIDYLKKSYGDIVDAIGGWARNSVGDNYGRGHNVATLCKWLSMASVGSKYTKGLKPELR